MQNIKNKIIASINHTNLNGYKRIAINPNSTFDVKYYLVENIRFHLEIAVIINECDKIKIFYE
jgi:hypothetical protein